MEMAKLSGGESDEEFMRMTEYPNGRPGYILNDIVLLKGAACESPSNMHGRRFKRLRRKTNGSNARRTPVNPLPLVVNQARQSVLGRLSVRALVCLSEAPLPTQVAFSGVVDCFVLGLRIPAEHREPHTLPSYS